MVILLMLPLTGLMSWKMAANLVFKEVQAVFVQNRDDIVEKVYLCL